VSVKPGPPAITVTGDTEFTTGTGMNVGSTVTGGLTETRRLFTNSRNSYRPPAVGIAAVQVRFVTP
jgi:hypothetical protein